ncbi:MAG: DUF1292 domain-containing protein [Oscillospiraceae bacterium]|nr:DUF1292 domain-containing protein [Oscillospiraceae bacterium]
MSDKFANNKFSVMAGGKEIVCDILFRFHSQKTGKDYMAFTDHSKGRDDSVNIFYATYDPDAESIDLAPIQTQEEWAMMRDITKQMQEDATKTVLDQFHQAMGASAPEEQAAEEKAE